MQRRGGVSQEELRRLNMSALLWRVHTSGSTTRAQLTMDLGLNRSTIGDLTGQLECLGLVSEEVPSGQVLAGGRRSGRPSLVVVPRQDVTVLAVALEVDRVTVALVGLGGSVLRTRSRRHEERRHDVARLVRTAAQLSRQLLRRSRVHCIGVGVSVCGAVRASDGLIHFAPSLGWVDEPFTELLGAELGLPVAADNDANLGVLAEHLRGAAVGVDDVAYVWAGGGVGLGAGLLLGGAPMRGADGYAGEVGHLVVDSSGPRCRCGLVGCWETRVGEDVLLCAVGRPSGGGPRAVAEVVRAADEDDRAAAAAVTDLARWIGTGLRGVVNAFNPRLVVLGGLLRSVWLARSPQVLAALDPPSLVGAHAALQLRPSALGDQAHLLGAAELAFAPLLGDPLRVGAAIRAETVPLSVGASTA